MIQVEQNKSNNEWQQRRTRIQIGSEKQSVVKHLLEALEQVRGEGIDIEDEAKEHHRRPTKTTKTTTPQQQENKKRQKHKKLAWSFKFMALHFI